MMVDCLLAILWCWATKIMNYDQIIMEQSGQSGDVADSAFVILSASEVVGKDRAIHGALHRGGDVVSSGDHYR